MTDRLATVLCASGRQGLAQVRALKTAGYRVRAVTRRQPAIENGDYAGVEWMAADLNDYSSLERVMEGASAVFYTPPAFTEVPKKLEHVEAVGRAARATKIGTLLYNTSVYIPAALGSEPPYDYVLEAILALEATGAPVISFGPVIFMDNLLADWSKPELLRGRFTYPHKPGFRASWIALDDVAHFMVAAIGRTDLVGRRFTLGGPDVLTPEILCTTLSDVLGLPIRHNLITPRQFGEIMWDIFGGGSGVDREAFVHQLDAFYTYSNLGPAEPFVVDMTQLAEMFGVRLTPLTEWARHQDWTIQSHRPPGG